MLRRTMLGSVVAAIVTPWHLVKHDSVPRVISGDFHGAKKLYVQGGDTLNGCNIFGDLEIIITGGKGPINFTGGLKGMKHAFGIMLHENASFVVIDERGGRRKFCGGYSNCATKPLWSIGDLG